MAAMKKPASRPIAEPSATSAIDDDEEGQPFKHIRSSVKDAGVQVPPNAPSSVFALGNLGFAVQLAPEPTGGRVASLPPPDIDSLVIESDVPMPPRGNPACRVFDKLLARMKPGQSVVLTRLQSILLYEAGRRAKVRVTKRRAEGEDAYRCWRLPPGTASTRPRVAKGGRP